MPFTYICLDCSLIYRCEGTSYRCKAYGKKGAGVDHLVCNKCGTEHLVRDYNDEQRAQRGYVLLAKEGPRYQPISQQEREGRLKPEHNEDAARMANPEKADELLGWMRLFYRIGVAVVQFVAWKFYQWASKPYWARNEIRGKRVPVPEFDEPWVEVERRRDVSCPEYDQFRCNFCGDMGSLGYQTVQGPCPQCGSDEIWLEDVYFVIHCGGRRSVH